MRNCSTCKTGKVGDWVRGSICASCLLDGKPDPRPSEEIPEEDMPINRHGVDDAKDY